MKHQDSTSSLLFFIAWWLCVATLSAQVRYEDQPLGSIPYEQREKLKEAMRVREPMDREIVDLEAEPWFDAAGQRLVGVVENRTMAKPQLDLRVKLFLANQSPLADPIKNEDRRVLVESRILSDWVQTTALAVHAERCGFQVTPQQVEQVIAQLAAQSAGDVGQTNDRMQMIGIPEVELRRETHDALLVEKLLTETVSRSYAEAQLRQIFERTPKVFLEPTRVEAWQIYQPLLRWATNKQIDKYNKNLKKFAKRLRKCKTDEDYLELKQKLDAAEGVKYVFTYLPRISENEPLPFSVMQQLFTLDLGKVSKPIRTSLGLHVVKVVKRIDGDQGTFEEARPKVENYLVEKMRDWLYESIKGQYDIQTNASGLNHWRPAASSRTAIGSASAADGASTQAVPRVPEQQRNAGERRLFTSPPPVKEVILDQAEPRS